MTAYLGGSCSFVCHFCAYSSFLFGFGGGMSDLNV